MVDVIIKDISDIENILIQTIKIGREMYGCNNILIRERFVEILTAEKLNHKWNPELRGADAWALDSDGKYTVPIEYKSSDVNTNKELSMQFCKPTYKLYNDLKEYGGLYIIKKDGADILEIWEASIPSLLPVFKYKMENKGKTNMRFTEKEMIREGILGNMVFSK